MKKTRKTILSAVLISGVAISLVALLFFFKETTLANTLQNGLYAEMETTQGNITLELFYEQVPVTAMNFVGLSEGSFTGKPFYDGLTFHRVVPDFVIQGGDPDGNGTGGPGYNFEDEFHPDLKHSSPGILSMANSGPDSNGSQFFITLKDTPWLDNRHSIFGKVILGMDIVNKIQQGDVIKTIKIIRVGDKAEAFLASKEKFEALRNEIKKSTSEKQRLNMQEYIQKNWPQAMKDPSGIYYQILSQGTGSTPQKNQQVKVHYQGTLVDGKVFDDSFARGEPIAFTYGQNQVIPGWEAALSTMKKGEVRMAIIPPELGYGSRGIGPIPPNSILVFKMELIEIGN